jgi:hypothetical protein
MLCVEGDPEIPQARGLEGSKWRCSQLTQVAMGSQADSVWASTTGAAEQSWFSP